MWKFKNNSHQIVFKEHKKNYTGKDINNFCKDIEQYLSKKKELVFLLSENSAGSLMGYISIIKLKHVPVMLDENINQRLLNLLLKKYKPKFIWLPKNNKISNFKKVFTRLNYNLLSSTNNKSYVFNPNLCLLTSTSGSTGSPKFVRQSYSNIRENTKSILRYLPINKKSITITTLPMNYTFGMSIINCHLKKNSTIVLNKFSIIEKKFWENLTKNNINTIYGVPYTFEILERMNFFKKNKINLIAQAGGKLNESLQKKIAFYSKKNKKKFFIMYGQAEATTRISYLDPKYSLSKLGSIGKEIFGGKIELIDNYGKKIKNSNTVGNLIYKGPNVCMGYAYNLKDLAKDYEWKNKLITGDLAYRDDEKFYYIYGRKKRFIKLYGLSINLDEIENILKLKFNKIDLCVTGSDINIFIYITNSNKSTLSNLIKYISNITNINSSVFRLKIIKKIPKLKSGKTNYKKLISN